MRHAILKFFENELGVNCTKAAKLIDSYYQVYGLAIAGIIKDFHVDPLEYNKFVDDALPLQDILKPDLQLRRVLLSLRESGYFDKFWLFTNAYKDHAIRVVKILGVADLFDGITYCDYTKLKFGKNHSVMCKPNPQYYQLAKLQSGLPKFENAWLVDDSWNNIKTAMELGFDKCFFLTDDVKTYQQYDRGQLSVINDILNVPTHVENAKVQQQDNIPKPIPIPIPMIN